MNARASLKEIEALLVDLSDDGVAKIVDYAKMVRDQEDLRKRNRQVTTEAIEAARRGELVRVGDVAGLMADLHADD